MAAMAFLVFSVIIAMNRWRSRIKPMLLDSMDLSIDGLPLKSWILGHFPSIPWSQSTWDDDDWTQWLNDIHRDSQVQMKHPCVQHGSAYHFGYHHRNRYMGIRGVVDMELGLPIDHDDDIDREPSYWIWNYQSMTRMLRTPHWQTASLLPLSNLVGMVLQRQFASSATMVSSSAVVLDIPFLPGSYRHLRWIDYPQFLTGLLMLSRMSWLRYYCLWCHLPCSLISLMSCLDMNNISTLLWLIDTSRIQLLIMTPSQWPMKWDKLSLAHSFWSDKWQEQSVWCNHERWHSGKMLLANMV